MKIAYNPLIKEFKQDAIKLAEAHVPGKTHLLRQDINQFLRKEQRKLRGWHCALVMQLISSEEFAKLFNGLRSSFKLNKLKVAGLSPERLIELAQLLRKLFRVMMIACAKNNNSK